MGESWRYRACPRCKAVHRATDLEFDDEYGAYWDRGRQAQRRCPTCGRRGLTGDFPVVMQKADGRWFQPLIIIKGGRR